MNTSLRPVIAVCVLLVSLPFGRNLYAADHSRVWVVFNAGQKESTHAELRKVQATVHHEFDDLRAVAATVPAAALDGLRHNPNIELVEADPPRYLLSQTVPYGIDKVQARDVWDANRDGVVDAGSSTGSGCIVCVIDSGVNVAHEDLAGLHITGEASGTGDWFVDGCGHGTHVVGTIVAGNNGLGVVGVTPGTVSIHMIKVFGDDCAWAYSSDLVYAARQCRTIGAKIISMSLGGSLNSATEDRAFNDLYNTGILSVAAAGNGGNSQFSYPASYSSVVSVGAVDKSDTVASFSQQNNQVELAAPGVGVLSTVPYVTPKVTVNAVDYLAGQIQYTATGTPSGTLVDGGKALTTDASWLGKVVLVERGDITFYEKVLNVQNSRGLAAVIYNNVAGGFSGTLGSGNSSAIPAVSITREEGLALKQSGLGSTANVDSPAPAVGSGYAYYDGTSMATPHVAAAAALVWNCGADKTNAQIRDALQKTAKDLGPAGKDNAYGYGLVQAKAALDYLGGALPPPPPPGDTLAVAITTDKGTYANRETVVMTVKVTSSGSPISGAAVHLDLTTANGNKLAADGTSDSSGVAQFNYKVNRKRDGIGTYTASASATKSGFNPWTDSTTFQVQ